MPLDDEDVAGAPASQAGLRDIERALAALGEDPRAARLLVTRDGLS